MHQLAIVIPAFKPGFFRSALESIANQTDRRFRLYVGSDAGPLELERLCDGFPDLDIDFHRYPDNLGSDSLAGHWNRCIGRTSESWVWLFADDDVMEPDCVASFYRELDSLEGHDVVRFDTTVIGASGEVIRENRPHPRDESGTDFIFARLRGERESFVVEYIFRRSAFDRAGGFAELPVAWCADDVSWFRFAGPVGIRTLRGGRVLWRASGLNITDANRSHQAEKLEAGTRFLEFVRTEVRPMDPAHPPAEWAAAEESWILGQIRYLMPFGPSLATAALRASRGTWRQATAARIAFMTLWNTQASLRLLRGALRSALSPKRSE